MQKSIQLLLQNEQREKMPYSIRKKKCRQNDGDQGRWILSYTDYSGKKHRNCHSSKKKARAQIAAMEMNESEDADSVMEIYEFIIRNEIKKILIAEVFHASDS